MAYECEYNSDGEPIEQSAPVKLAFHADHLKKRNIVLAVARLQADGKLCGYVLCTSTGVNIHVAKVAVREDCRRQGMARRMMEAVLQAAATVRRALSSTLYVAVENTPAVELYKSLGFAEDSYLANYYAPGRHARRMICELEPYKVAAAAANTTGGKKR